MLNDLNSRVYNHEHTSVLGENPLRIFARPSSNGSHIVYSKVFLQCRDEVVIFMLTLKVSPNITRKKKTHFVMH